MKRVLVSAIVATLAVVGCSNADTASSAAWYDPRSKDGPDALATGTLEEIDGCIYLISVDDGGRYLPVFRGRPTWTPEARSGPTPAPTSSARWSNSAAARSARRSTQG